VEAKENIASGELTEQIGLSVKQHLELRLNCVFALQNEQTHMHLKRSADLTVNVALTSVQTNLLLVVHTVSE
jgi:hypothetical protein